MQGTARRRGRHDEDGAVAVITAITLTVLIMMAAFVIDLGFLRADRTLSKAVADMAAAAAVLDHDPGVSESFQEACLEAVAFVEANLRLTASEVAGESCMDVFLDDHVCDPTSPESARYTLGDSYRLRVTIPVDEDDRLMENVVRVGFDGEPCQRVGVELERDREYFLAGVAGFTDGTTVNGAVARTGAGDNPKDFASLIVLHRQTCEALRAGGSSNARIEVNDRPDPDPDDPNTSRIPGVITVDSLDDGCGGQNAIIQTDGSNAAIYAEDFINSEQLRVDPANTGKVYLATDNITPTPTPGGRITRTPVDHPYNCMDTYPSGERWSPTHAWSVSSAGSCDEAGELPPYIAELHAAYQDMTTADVPTSDPAWRIIDDCNLNRELDGPITQSHVLINCTGPQGFTPRYVEFENAQLIVSRGPINVGSNRTFVVNGNPDTGAVLYIQRRRFETSGENVQLNGVFMYIEGRDMGPSENPLSIGGNNSANFTWEAPLATPAMVATCDAYNAAWSAGTAGAPPAACFAPLALWSNHFNMHTLGGNGAVRTVGSFFTPNAQPFRLRGGSDSDYVDSQFFSGTIDAGGGGTVTLAPNPDTNIPTQPADPGLIR